MAKTLNESEMALLSECMPKCARKVLDTADIVREAILRQQSARSLGCQGARILLELAVYGTTAGFQDAEIAYQLSQAINYLYLVKLATESRAPTVNRRQ